MKLSISLLSLFIAFSAFADPQFNNSREDNRGRGEGFGRREDRSYYERSRTCQVDMKTIDGRFIVSFEELRCEDASAACDKVLRSSVSRFRDFFATCEVVADRADYRGEAERAYRLVVVKEEREREIREREERELRERQERELRERQEREFRERVLRDRQEMEFRQREEADRQGRELRERQASEARRRQESAPRPLFVIVPFGNLGATNVVGGNPPAVMMPLVRYSLKNISVVSITLKNATAQCIQGATWGYDNKDLWAGNCRGDFVITYFDKR